MHIEKIRVKNFRSLKDLEVELESYLSIIVGKNNSGKTSLLLVMERFFNGSSSVRFEFDDFNIDFQKYLVVILDDELMPSEPFPTCGISMRLFIKYDENDNLANVGNKVIMDLDPANRWIVMDFLYHLPYENLASLKRDYKAYRDKKIREGKTPKETLEYLRDEFRHHFKLGRRSVRFDHVSSKVIEADFVDLIKENVRIDDIISFKRINARRSVSNRDTERGLSFMSSKIYEAMSPNTEDEDIVEAFTDALTKADCQLNEVYDSLFKEVTEDVRRFGGIREGDTQLKIVSSLKQSDMLIENTTVKYGQGAELHVLPEGYNGLGYLNLISIIFEIKILLNEYKRGAHPKPADINLLFIEEPEAHTHPQMQAIFIKNIKCLVGKWVQNSLGVLRPLQTVISTHSSHIVAESDFDDIKYFRKIDGYTKSRNLRDLKTLYEETGFPGHYKFLKQYLTLSRSQLFFADKAILVEGDTERILLPAMMRKKDLKDDAEAWKASEQAPLALLSQNISVIEVGAHSHIYEIFLDFIGIKTLIITDIDSAIEIDVLDKDGNVVLTQKGTPKKSKPAHAVEGSTHTSNYALQFYHGVGADIAYFIALTTSQKTVIKDPETGKWGPHGEGRVMCVYQVNEPNQTGYNYHARSFEDAFFHINREFIADASTPIDGIKKIGFPSLTPKYLREYLNNNCSSYDMAELGITKKPSFAIEVLLNSTTKRVSIARSDGREKNFDFEFNNWKTPRYLEEGLEWIKQG
ncbi:ATP-dependent nuclease [Acetobacter sicerae]|uniref:ATP-dependent nuclease n=1 Tax=Acetobacter sicerae TaxID=85325 RepID=UPI00156AE671|nr:AAA family ATPase [Acetobacter sicerae]NHN92749.1 AAA family ATPase [Acetobacter sicerae]